MSTDLTATPQAGAEPHRYADALLAALSTEAPPPPPPPGLAEATAGWLPPALEALSALVRGEDALEPLGRAAQHDGRRTALFLCLALAAAGQGDRIHASWFGTAFGDLSTDGPVTPGQRALWLAAARGAYGPAGKIFVLRKLDAVSVSETPDPARWLRALAPDEPSIVVPPSLTDFPEIAQLPELARPVHAAIQLSRLRGRCVEITSVREDHDSAGRPSRLSAQDPEGEPATVLRRLIVSGEVDEPAHSLADYLLADLRPGSDPRLAAIALHVAAPTVRSAAENLVRATQSAPPATVTISLLGHDVVLHPEGPDPASLSAAEKQLASESVPARGLPWPAYTLFALGAVLVCAAFLVPALPALPSVAVALLLSAAGAYLLWQRRAREQEDADYVAAQLSELRELADGAVWALHEYAREADKRAQTAASDLTELTRLLRRGPRAG
ncbi:hypothetical protein ACFOWE_18650 [Planomonospora corallina]|uniref:Uncharacterized protein n=1 Tax=Planomonospora corallina TaxID=1806052 RepID=A0ABV8ICV1_9ACTN